jgi:hypothetical protein
MRLCTALLAALLTVSAAAPVYSFQVRVKPHKIKKHKRHKHRTS